MTTASEASGLYDVAEDVVIVRYHWTRQKISGLLRIFALAARPDYVVVLEELYVFALDSCLETFRFHFVAGHLSQEDF